MELINPKVFKKGDRVTYNCRGGSGIPAMNGYIARVEWREGNSNLYYIRFPWPHFVTMSATNVDLKSS